ncbi:hypothetical protein EDB81DRAFT_692560 [Dactylonectria macrodidyma]|uniref:Zn(2)-C6 fungal-type domain-containing protein n=1 Tax=Dactylonectria macrodidyma TaxID=307937 RepID=A0A9P9IYY9_9HYPO|nr:hypothetical protein EDB81DRAFT_692560 [Dactylonectria macrodidyma]
MKDHQASQPAPKSSKTVKARRGHIKSRHGCFECKRRHYKCDEARPICAHCNLGRRECIYPAKPRIGVDFSEAPQSTSLSIAVNSHVQSESPESGAAKETGITLNMLHLELLHHFTAETFVPEMGNDLLDTVKLVIETGLHAPYLMYETLALSARRLACLRTPEQDMYMCHAMQLQTHAISLFNNDRSKVDETSCVARLLFSSLMSRHLLSDALAHRDSGLDSFLDNFIRYNRLHRSIRSLSGDAWPFLRKSKLRDVMLWGEAVFTIQPRGHHCDEVARLLLSSNLDQNSREACQRATHFLQIGFDESKDREAQGRTIHIIFWWAILMPEEFLDLLANRNPVAIIILGYYAALLEHRKRVWLIGDAANYLLNSVAGFLGDEWSGWLAAPQSLLLNPYLEPGI